MVALDVAELLHRGPQTIFVFSFVVLSFCLCSGSVHDGVEISSAESQVLRHPSSGNVHHLIFGNESTVSRVYRSKADLIYSVGDIPQQELQARPLVRDAGHESCPSDAPCNRLNAECLTCKFNYSCVYGDEVAVMCQPKSGIKCIDKSGAFERKMICRYCYQTANSEHTCDHNSTCQVNSAPRQRYIATCNVRPDVLCLGRRQFHKNLLCNYTRGYSWWTALVLSIVLGGFGADRFYLGMWQEGIGKLFSFGGLGVWTLVDVVLVAAGYLGPADGSLYIS
ncbi:TM2 domain-containing protein 3 [Dermacentor albipictus]|uniref:TM2 domain-containing protein 3 n=1 Tax=Dermacentor albipictus TaxID=60249 RepID=UPI0038FCA0F9